MYKWDLALNNLHWLICHKSQPNETKPDSGEKKEEWYYNGLIPQVLVIVSCTQKSIAPWPAALAR